MWHLLTYLLTPWKRVLLEKLTGFQLVKKFPKGIRKFITAFTSARHLSLSWFSSIQSIPPHPTSWRSILLLSTHLPLGLPSGLFLSGVPPKPCIWLSSPHTCYMPRPFHFSRFYHHNNIGWVVQTTQLLIMQLSPLLCYLVPPRPNILLSTLLSNIPSLRSSIINVTHLTGVVFLYQKHQVDLMMIWL